VIDACMTLCLYKEASDKFEMISVIADFPPNRSAASDFPHAGHPPCPDPASGEEGDFRLKPGFIPS
jgi:hypothetical protein